MMSSLTQEQLRKVQDIKMLLKEIDLQQQLRVLLIIRLANATVH